MVRLSIENIYFGPSPSSPEPVIVGSLEIGEDLAARADGIICEIEALTGRWFRRDPVETRHDDAERLADFIMRWAFAALTYPPSSLSDFGCLKVAPSRFRTWISFHDPKVALSALELAVNLVALAAREKVDADHLQAQLGKLWTACRSKHPDAQAQIAMGGAKLRGIPSLPAWNMTHHWQFGWGAKSKVLFLGASNRDGFVSSRIIGNKQSSKALIRRLGLPTPDDTAVNGEEELAAAIEATGLPCVVKPIDRGGGSGVTTGLNTLDEVRAAFHRARKLSDKPVMIEAQAPGSDHRLMIMGGRLAGTFRRDPPIVVGDGTRTVRELVDAENWGRALPGVESISRLAPIVLDKSAERHLARQGLTPDDILPRDGKAVLRGNANLATGGSCTDVSAEVHPEVRMAAETLARTLEVNLAGFDYMTTDIGCSWREVPGAFIELNLTPALDVPTLAGWHPAEVGKLVLGSQAGRIPLELAIVPDRQVAMAEAQLADIQTEETSGWASHDHARLGSLSLEVRGSHPWIGVISLLSHRLLADAVLVVASSHMQKFGLPVDRADRIWICEDDLPERWIEVARKASQSDIRTAAWDEFLTEFRAGRATVMGN